jgi:DNA modification methylase
VRDHLSDRLPNGVNAPPKCKSNGSPHPLVIQHLPISSLQVDQGNPRRHSAKQIRQVAESIKVFGFNVPILIDANRKIIAGHCRFQASQLLKIPEVPTICLDHLSPQQVQAFMIADNKLTENGEWDSVLLGQQLRALSEAELEFSTEITGFEIGEIDVLIEGLHSAIEPTQDSEDAIPEESQVQVTRTADLWQLGKHRVLCGDALDTESCVRLMSNGLAVAVFTDPPYNVPIRGHASGLGRKHHRDFAMAAGEMNESEYTDFLYRAMDVAARHSRDGSIHFVCIDWRHLRELLTAGLRAYDELKNLCVWVKDNAGMGSFYRSQHELVLVFKRGKAGHRNNVQLGQFGRYRSNVWRYAGMNSFSRSTEEGNLLDFHPTVKPVALVADAIMDCTARGDIVLDPFLGSGTTVIAAERTGRTCYGLEIDSAYVDTIIRRWQAFTGSVAVHATSGRTFNDLEAEASQ